MFESGILKDILPPSKFPKFGYVVVILYLLSEVFFVGFAANLRSREQEEFHCNFPRDIVSDQNYHQERCYKKYDNEYCYLLPLWGFVLLKFIPVLTVCLIYSCYVPSGFARVDPYVTSDVERPQFKQRSESHRIHRCYFLHLVARLVLTTLFVVLQTSVFFPFLFPIEYSCVSPTETEQAWNVTNSKSSRNTTITANTVLNCQNSLAKDKTTLSAFILILNIIFVFLVFGEIISLVLRFRASQSSNFTDDTELCLKCLFNRSSTHSFSNRRKNLILQQTENVLLTTCEDKKFTDDIFVDPVVHLKKGNGEFIEVNSYEELYAPKVLVVGSPGAGKSLLCHKLLRDWSKQKTSLHSFNFAFLFEFGWFNSKSTDTMSLMELLNRGERSEDVVENGFEQLLDNPEKILLIFDGLDEFKNLKSYNDGKKIELEDSLTQKIPVSTLHLKLLQNKLLPGATVLTTSRYNVIKSDVASCFDKIFEIKDFTEEKVHKYVDNHCKQDADLTIVTRMKEQISATSYLLSLCYIPVYCHIVCNLLKNLLINEGSSDGVRKTVVYQKALRFFIFKHHPYYRDKPFPENHGRFSDSVEKTLTKLEVLARRGIFTGQSMFCSEEVVDAIKNCGLLKITTDENGKQHFSFIHPTFQDFLAARRIVRMRNPDELKKKIIHVLKVKDTDWFLVLQFVMGLLYGQQHDAVSAFVNCLHDSLLSSPTNGIMALLTMKCLYEYNNEAVVEDLASRLQQNSGFNKAINLQKCEVTSADCKAIVYFLKHFDSLESVDVSGNSIGERGHKELAKLLQTQRLEKLYA